MLITCMWYSIALHEDNNSNSGGMCVCVFFPFILDIKFVGRTSRGHTGGRSHRISHSPSFSAVRALIFLARRIQLFLSLVDRDVDFFVLTI